MPRGELLDRTSSRELSDWQIYERVEPFGETRADLRMGIVASVIANANRDPKKRPSPFAPSDFMPFVEAGDPTPDEVAAKVAAALGAPD